MAIPYPGGSNSNMIKLPAELWPNGILTLSVLVTRPTRVASGFEVWMGRNKDLAGDIPVTSYQLLATHNRFALHGILQEDYPDTTDEIDRTIGAMVLLDGVDVILDEQSEFGALVNEFLLIIGDEIMAVFSATLLSPNFYRLNVVRNRLSTIIASHTAGDDCWLIARKDLIALQDDHFVAGYEVTFKVVPFGGDIAAMDPAIYLIP